LSKKGWNYSTNAYLSGSSNSFSDQD